MTDTMSLGSINPSFQDSPFAAQNPDLMMEFRASPEQTGEANLTTTTTAPAPTTDRSSLKLSRRAARACLVCRRRKVRCDATERYPCGNCKWSNVECIIRDRRRPGPSVPRSAEIVPNFRATKPDETIRSHDFTAHSRIDRFSDISDLSMSGINAAPTATLMLDGIGDHALNLISASQRIPQHLHSHWNLNSSCHLPAFIKPLPERIPPEDVTFLHARGVFDIPSPSLQSALLRGYVECFHPYMPLLDLDEFLNIVSARDGRCGQVSLLLYHTVMFAGMAFVDMKYVREAGYLTQKCARKAIFKKIRALYDFDYEQDSLILIQALIIMGFWYETLGEQKDAWHWTGAAISLAYAIGLNRDPTNTDIIPRRQTLRKRIWWSCFIRDRLTALGLRRATRIKDEDFDVPMLNEKDFNAELLLTANRIHPDITFIGDLGSQKVLALLCIAKAKLCVCMGHVLDARDSIGMGKNRLGNTGHRDAMLSPNPFDLEIISSCDQELLRWADSLPQCCRSEPLAPSAIESATGTVAVRNLLHLGYCATVLTLYSPLLVWPPSLHPHDKLQEVQATARIRVRDAAAQITRLVSEIRLLRLERYLQTNGITAMLPPLIIHMLETNAIPQCQGKSTDGFRTCIAAIEKVCEMYAATGFAMGFFDVALRNATVAMYAASDQDGVKGGSPLVQTPTDREDRFSMVTESFLEELPHLETKENEDCLTHPDEFNASPTSMTDTSDSEGAELRTSGCLSTVTGPTPPASILLEPGDSEPPTDLDFVQDELDWTSLPDARCELEQWLQIG